MRHQAWTSAEVELLRDLYADVSGPEIARLLGRKIQGIYAKAMQLGLRKPREVIAQMARERSADPNHGGHATLFKPGNRSWNTGIKGSTGLHPNCRRTQFKAGTLNGRATQLVAPLGALRINADGALERKVTEMHGAPHLRWHPVSRLVWEAAHGKVPAGHIVVFKPGMKTTALEEITLDRLELISRAERMRRNSLHTNYPPEVARVVQLRGALTRQINRKSQEQGHE